MKDNDWIPAYAGMTKSFAGMTYSFVRMTYSFVGIKGFARLKNFAGITVSTVGLSLLFGISANAASLNEYLSNFQSLKANFTQTAASTLGGKTTSIGKIWIQKPGKFRWDILKPFPQLFVSDGTNVWRYEPALLQATVQPINQKLSQTPIMLLSGKVTNVSTLFNVQQSSPGVFTLTPKNTDSLIKSVTLKFKGNAISEFDLTSAQMQQTTVAFNNVSLNKPLNPKLFQFKPPKGVDVLKG